MKKALSLFLALLFCTALFLTPASAQTFTAGEEDDPADSWRYENGELIKDHYAIAPLADPYHPDATLRGIDVSRHQGRINWQQVKNAGIDFAIIRCGYGGNYTSQDDAFFLYNATECERLGIPYGVYLYSYAKDTAQAGREADHALRLLEGRTLDYPVYLDMEDNSTLGSDFAAIASTFCGRLQAADYPVGIYASLYWWNTYLTDPCFDNWHRWIAQWNTTCSYTGTYALWQYTSSGAVPGINGPVDLNYQIGWPADHGAGDPDIPAGEQDVLRLFGQTRYETSLKIADELKKQLDVENFQTVILASGANFADALAGSYLSKIKAAPILMAHPAGQNIDVLKAYIDANLAPGGQIYILGGPAAVPTEMDAALTGYNVRRLAGATRYDTNIAILQEAGVTDEELLVCSAADFADSLSASATGRPILLVNNHTGALTEAQKTFLSGINTTQYYIIGGTFAVSETLEATLRTYGNVERIGGADRYETSVLVAQKFFDTPTAAVLAYSLAFPDGLCGGPLAGSMNAPLLLTKTDSHLFVREYTHTNNIITGAVLGGPSLISDATAMEVFQTNTILLPQHTPAA